MPRSVDSDGTAGTYPSTSSSDDEQELSSARDFAAAAAVGSPAAGDAEMSVCREFGARLLNSLEPDEFVMRGKFSAFSSIAKWRFLQMVDRHVPKQLVRDTEVFSGADLAAFLRSARGGLPDTRAVENCFNVMYWHGAMRRAFKDKPERQYLDTRKNHWYYIIPAARSQMRVSVSVVAARNLLGKSSNGSADPYAIVELDGQQTETSIVPQCLNPTWDEVFDLGYEGDDEVLQLNLWDYNPHAPNKFLGRVSFRVADVRDLLVKAGQAARAANPRFDAGGAAVVRDYYVGGVEVEEWFPLQKRTSRSHVQGDVKLRLAMYDAAQRFAAEEEASRSEEHEIKSLGFLSRAAERVLRVLSLSDAPSAALPSAANTETVSVDEESGSVYHAGPSSAVSVTTVSEPDSEQTVYRGELHGASLSPSKRLCMGCCMLAGMNDLSDFHYELVLHSVQLTETHRIGPLSGADVWAEIVASDTIRAASMENTLVPIGHSARREVSFRGETIRCPLAPRLFANLNVWASTTGLAHGKPDKNLGTVFLLVPNIPVWFPNSAPPMNAAAGGVVDGNAMRKMNIVQGMQRTEFPLQRRTRKRRLIQSGVLVASIAIVYHGPSMPSSASSSLSPSPAGSRDTTPLRGSERPNASPPRDTGIPALPTSPTPSTTSSASTTTTTTTTATATAIATGVPGSSLYWTTSAKTPNLEGKGVHRLAGLFHRNRSASKRFEDNIGAVTASLMQQRAKERDREKAREKDKDESDAREGEEGEGEGERELQDEGIVYPREAPSLTRTVSYVMYDPKDTLAIERQTFPSAFAANYISLPENRHGLLMTVRTTTPTVSYGKSFETALQFRLRYIDNEHTRLTISQEMVFPLPSSPNNFIRAMIRKFATKGTRNTYDRYVVALRDYIAENGMGVVPPAQRGSNDQEPELEGTAGGEGAFPPLLENKLVEIVLPLSLSLAYDVLFASDSPFVQAFYSSERYAKVEIGDWIEDAHELLAPQDARRGHAPSEKPHKPVATGSTGAVVEGTVASAPPSVSPAAIAASSTGRVAPAGDSKAAVTGTVEERREEKGQEKAGERLWPAETVGQGDMWRLQMVAAVIVLLLVVLYSLWVG